MAGSDREHARQPLLRVLGGAPRHRPGRRRRRHLALRPDRPLARGRAGGARPSRPRSRRRPASTCLRSTRPEAVARPLPERPRLDRAAVRRAVQSDLSDRDLGRHVLAVVAPLGAGAPAYTLGSGLAMPASTTKVVTSAAALYALGADHVFETTVVPDGRRRVVLVGGGDPLLASTPDDRRDGVPAARRRRHPREADGEGAAEEGDPRRTAGLRRRAVHRARRVTRTGSADYIPDAVVSPTSALWVDEGRPASGFGRVADPAARPPPRRSPTRSARPAIRVQGAPEETRAPRHRSRSPRSRARHSGRSSSAS